MLLVPRTGQVRDRRTRGPLPRENAPPVRHYRHRNPAPPSSTQPRRRRKARSHRPDRDPRHRTPGRTEHRESHGEAEGVRPSRIRRGPHPLPTTHAAAQSRQTAFLPGRTGQGPHLQTPGPRPLRLLSAGRLRLSGQQTLQRPPIHPVRFAPRRNQGVGDGEPLPQPGCVQQEDRAPSGRTDLQHHLPATGRPGCGPELHLTNTGATPHTGGEKITLHVPGDTAMALGIRMEHDPRRIRVPARVMKRGHDRQKRPIPHLHDLGPPDRLMPFPHTTAPSPRTRPAQDHHTEHETVPDPTGSAGTRRRSPAGRTPSPGSGAGTPTNQGGNCARRRCGRCLSAAAPATGHGRHADRLGTSMGHQQNSGAARSPCESQPRWIFSTDNEWVSAANAPRRVASRIESAPGGRTLTRRHRSTVGVHDRQAPSAVALPMATALPPSLTPVASPAPLSPGAPLRLPGPRRHSCSWSPSSPPTRNGACRGHWHPFYSVEADEARSWCYADELLPARAD